MVKDLLEFGSNKGIAGEFHFASMDDVFNSTPFRKEWNYCDGDFTDSLSVTAVLASGETQKLEEAVHIGYASNYRRDYKVFAPTIGEQIAGWNVNALIFTRVIDDQNEDSKEEEYLAITPPDWKVVRRRVEDALRKTSDMKKIFACSQVLQTKIY